VTGSPGPQQTDRPRERALEVAHFGQLLPADALKVDVSHQTTADAARAILARLYDVIPDP
jgi:hypothetical protein